MLSHVTSLLALVTAPPLDTTEIRRVEVLLLQPQVVMVVVITSTGGVTKKIFPFPAAVDPKLVEWAGEFLNEQLGGVRVGHAHAPDPAARAGALAGRAAVDRHPAAGLHRAGRGRRADALHRWRRAAVGGDAIRRSGGDQRPDAGARGAHGSAGDVAQRARLAAVVRARRRRQRGAPHAARWRWWQPTTAWSPRTWARSR